MGWLLPQRVSIASMALHQHMATFPTHRAVLRDHAANAGFWRT
jgi:hypothetical protein